MFIDCECIVSQVVVLLISGPLAHGLCVGGFVVVVLDEEENVTFHFENVLRHLLLSTKRQ
jgi:hypothetical protein